MILPLIVWTFTRDTLQLHISFFLATDDHFIPTLVCKSTKFTQGKRLYTVLSCQLTNQGSSSNFFLFVLSSHCVIFVRYKLMFLLFES